MRLQKAGAPVHFLNRNHRAYRGTAKFCSINFYEGQIRAITAGQEDEIDDIVKTITHLILPGLRSSFVAIDIQGDTEQQVGKSTRNIA